MIENPMFQDEATPPTDEELAFWRQQLVLANVHMRRLESLKKAMARATGDRVKHYKSVSAALADAIRFKSHTELERGLGKNWEEDLDNIKPLDRWTESLARWHDEECK